MLVILIIDFSMQLQSTEEIYYCNEVEYLKKGNMSEYFLSHENFSRENTVQFSSII